MAVQLSLPVESARIAVSVPSARMEPARQLHPINIKVNRTGEPNVMIYKPSIKYMYKESEGKK